MKKQSARPLYRRLGILMILVLAWGTLSSPTEAMSEYTGCGEPYILPQQTCWFWVFFCSDTSQACADCDQGTACYNMY
jgi:hypothetical protein